MQKIKDFFKKLFKFVFSIILLFVAVTILINCLMIVKTKDRIIAEKDAANLTDVDCIIVLGCSASNGKASPMLGDRLDKAVELYNLDCSDIILMSGDNEDVYYNEVGVMKEYAIKAGVPSEDIFLDHEGYSTYESFYRLKEKFGAKKVVIVTQEYHLYRAIYLAEAMGIEAYGVSARNIRYVGQEGRDLRELIARDKDFVVGIIKPDIYEAGESVELSGDGNRTNDK